MSTEYAVHTVPTDISTGAEPLVEPIRQMKNNNKQKTENQTERMKER